MKTKLLILFFLVAVIIACKTETESNEVTNNQSEQVSLVELESKVELLLDDYHEALKAENSAVLFEMFKKDIWILGTDPNEHWDVESFKIEIDKLIVDTTFKLEYELGERRIKIMPDGKSAVAIEQFTINIISEKVPVRLISQAINEDGNWKFSLISWNFIPKNEDLMKLNEALE